MLPKATLQQQVVPSVFMGPKQTTEVEELKTKAVTFHDHEYTPKLLQCNVTS